MKRILWLIPVLLIVGSLLTWRYYKSFNSLPDGIGLYPQTETLGRTIYIQPIDDIDPLILSYCQSFISSDFKLPVQILPSIPTPYFPEGRKGQVKADFLRDHVMYERKVPKDLNRMIILTNDDIYTDGYNFIFGQASVSGLDLVISISRLIPQQDGGTLSDNPDEQCRNLAMDRLRKLIRHELGHTYGLSHCKNPECVMAFHESLMELDMGGDYFCDKCLEKIETFRKRYPGE